MAFDTYPDGRVLFAPNDPALEEEPDWQRLDDVYPGLVAAIELDVGRQTEFDTTETGTAQVHINDRHGLFDPDNVSSPYFGELDGKQIVIQTFNPVTSEWKPQFRGHIDEYGWTHRASQVSADVTISCVDIMDYLGNVKMIPGLFGDVPVPTSVGSGNVFYDNTDFQTRITQILGNAGLPAEWFRVFTGNVDIQESIYAPDDPILNAVRDALDADFPGIANGYVDKKGRFVCHGRQARFDPVTVSGTTGGDWDFTDFKAGDGAAIADDATRAQIRPPLQWSRQRSRIVNAAICYPRFPLRPDKTVAGGTFRAADVPGNIVVDAGSVAAYGYRSWEARELLTLDGFVTGNDAATETFLYASYYVENYKNPRTRVEALTFKSLEPSDPRATATWDLLTNADISDRVNLRVGYPGGVGLDGDAEDGVNFFVEGRQMSIRPLRGSDEDPFFDLIELSLNVSPEAYFLTNVFLPSS